MNKLKTFHDWYDDPDNGVDVFGKDLAAITAKQLRKIKPEDRDKALTVLQDHTSLFSPYVSRLTQETLEKHP